jgi:hypothetical protein
MPITINGSGTVTGISAGGLPDGSITPADLSTGAPTWDSSGRLLVGTSTARTNLYGTITSPFQVESSSNDLSRTAIFSHNSSSIAGPLVNFVKSRGTSNGTVNLVQNGDELGAVLFAGTDGTIPIQGAAIVGYVDGTPGANDMPGRLVFSTTADGASIPTERMRVGSTGLTDIYSTNSTVLGLHTDLTTGNAGMMIGYNNASSTQNGTVVVVIRADGDLENANNSYGAYSDEKLKENIVGAGSQWSDIKSLTVRKFNFKEDTGFSTHTQIGLVAQEAELVSPGLVSESPDRDEEGNDLGTVTKSVNYSVLYMKAVKALQEAMERIETLEASNADLLSRVAALEVTP